MKTRFTNLHARPAVLVPSIIKTVKQRSSVVVLITWALKKTNLASSNK